MIYVPWVLFLLSMAANVCLVRLYILRGKETTTAWENRDYWRDASEEHSTQAGWNMTRAQRIHGIMKKALEDAERQLYLGRTDGTQRPD